MPLDPHTKTLLDQMEALGAPPIWKLEVDQARASMNAMVAMMGPGEEVAEVEDRTIDAAGQLLPVRIYRPAEVGAGPAPALVFYHGGGFVIGGLDTHDRDCRALANRGGCVVVSVDYRLAPEHPFPAAVDDAAAALRWIVDHAADLGVDADRLAIGGDSAGGNISAVTALWRARRRDRAAPAAADLPGRRLVGQLPVEGRERHRLPARPGIDGVVHRALLRTRHQPRRLAGRTDARRPSRRRRARS